VRLVINSTSYTAFERVYRMIWCVVAVSIGMIVTGAPFTDTSEPIGVKATRESVYNMETHIHAATAYAKRVVTIGVVEPSGTTDTPCNPSQSAIIDCVDIDGAEHT